MLYIMFKNVIISAFLSAGLWLGVSGDTCTNCVSTYTTARDSAPNDNVKCTALQTYLVCLEGASGAGCPISASEATTIGSDYDNITLTCFLSEPCHCQKDYWKNIHDNCNAAKSLISCLRATNGLTGTSAKGCDEVTTVPTLATSAEVTIANFGSCSVPERSGCRCEVDYVTSDVSTSENLCKHTKIFISCVKSLDEKMCDGQVTVPSAAQTANSVIAAIGAICTIPLSSACNCEIDYARADISDNSKKCTEVKHYINCLKGKTGKDCADNVTVVDLATAAELTAAALPSCDLADTPCGCELKYAKSDISTNSLKCIELKKYMGCLKGKTGTGCDGLKSVPDLVTEAESTATNIASCDLAGTTCGCEVAFAKKETSTNETLCTETKNLVSCLKTKTGIACDNQTTVIELATAAETVIIGLPSCNIMDTPCACEMAYAKASISTDTLLCTKTKMYGGCLKKKTGTGCDGSTSVANLVTAAESTMTGIPDQACNNTGACACEFSYAKGDIATEVKKCTETKKYISCLKSKTGTGCDMITNVSQLAVEAEVTTLNIPGENCSLTGTPCECETIYAKADISSDILLCNETKKYGGCLKARTGNGCDGTSSVATLVTTAEGTLSGIVGEECVYTNNACGCELSYAKGDISTDFKKCIQTKAYVSCLKDKKGPGCNGTTTVDLAREAEFTINAIPDGECPLENTVCSCDVQYAKSIITNNISHCVALKNYMSCLLGKTGSGCDGLSTLRVLAHDTDTKIAALGDSECPRTTVCECESAYAKADVSTSLNVCQQTKSLTICIQNSLDNGCGATVTRAHVGNFTEKVFTSLGPNLCPLSDTCQCQINFNRADVSASHKCSAAILYDACLGGLNKTTETGCDDITLNQQLLANSSNSKPIVCASGSKTEVGLFSPILMIFLIFSINL